MGQGEKHLKRPREKSDSIEATGSAGNCEQKSTLISNFPVSKESQDFLAVKGIYNFFPIQAKSFMHIYEKKDLLGRARTGTGKTLAFALPSIERLIAKGKFHPDRQGRSPQIIVLLPTRELAQQVGQDFELLKGKRYETLCVYGGTPEHTQISALRKGVDVVVGCPGRVLDFISRKLLNIEKVRIMILDEADKMLEMGFKESVDEIINAVKLAKNSVKGSEGGKDAQIQFLLFSATIPSWVRKLTEEVMGKDMVTVNVIDESVHGSEGGSKSGGIRHLAIQCGFHQRVDILHDLLLMYAGLSGKCVIFTETKQLANEITMKSSISHLCQVLHGDIQQSQREIALQAFKEGRYRCLVATDVAARGLHIDDIDLVVQLSPPRDADTYIHRAGRTGRAGRSGTAVIFCNISDYHFLSQIEKEGKFVFQRTGVPQIEEIMRRTGDVIVNNVLENRNSSSPIETLSNFLPSATKMISEIQNLIDEERAQKKRKTADDSEESDSFQSAAVEAVAMCLCELSGFYKPGRLVIKSALNGRPHFKSYIATFNGVAIQTNAYVWKALKSSFPGNDILIDKITSMTLSKDGMQAVFDVAADLIKEFEEMVHNSKRKSTTTILPVTGELPDMAMPKFSESSHGYSSGGSGFGRFANSQGGRRNQGYGWNRNNKQRSYGGR